MEFATGILITILSAFLWFRANKDEKQLKKTKGERGITTLAGVGLFLLTLVSLYYDNQSQSKLDLGIQSIDEKVKNIDSTIIVLDTLSSSMWILNDKMLTVNANTEKAIEDRRKFISEYDTINSRLRKMNEISWDKINSGRPKIHMKGGVQWGDVNGKAAIKISIENYGERDAKNFNYIVLMILLDNEGIPLIHKLDTTKSADFVDIPSSINTNMLQQLTIRGFPKINEKDSLSNIALVFAYKYSDELTKLQYEKEEMYLWDKTSPDGTVWNIVNMEQQKQIRRYMSTRNIDMMRILKY